MENEDKKQPIQTSLFESGAVSEKQKKESDDFHWRQFCKLGEMMGDGLHHEHDGKWIVKEYNALAKILIPEMGEFAKKKRKLLAEQRDEQMKKLLADKKCSCGGELKQKRSGAKVCYCVLCDQRYVASSKKK